MGQYIITNFLRSVFTGRLYSQVLYHESVLYFGIKQKSSDYRIYINLNCIM